MPGPVLSHFCCPKHPFGGVLWGRFVGGQKSMFFKISQKRRKIKGNVQRSRMKPLEHILKLVFSNSSCRPNCVSRIPWKWTCPKLGLVWQWIGQEKGSSIPTGMASICTPPLSWLGCCCVGVTVPVCTPPPQPWAGWGFVGLKQKLWAWSRTGPREKWNCTTTKMCKNSTSKFELGKPVFGSCWTHPKQKRNSLPYRRPLMTGLLEKACWLAKNCWTPPPQR